MIFLTLITIKMVASFTAENKITNIKNWLQGNGAFISPKLTVEEIPNMGFGFVAGEPIASYETLCAVPLSCCMFSLLPNIDDSLNFICKHLLKERIKSSDSIYLPFVSLLPEDTSFLPSLWSQERHHRLSGTSMVNDALQLRQRWLENSRDYHVSDDELLWARGTLQCRAFSFRIPPSWDLQELKQLQRLNHPELINEKEQLVQGDSHNAVVFMPFISIANHDDKKFCSVSLGDYDGRPCVLLHSDTQRYKPGEAVCISYGEMSFQQKLLSFGWVDRTMDVSTSFCITPLTIVHHGERVEVEIKSRIVSNAGEAKLKPSSMQSELRKVAARITAVSSVVITESEALALLKEQLIQRLNDLLPAATTLQMLHWLDTTPGSKNNEDVALKEMSDEQFVVFVEARAVQQILKHL